MITKDEAVDLIKANFDRDRWEDILIGGTIAPCDEEKANLINLSMLESKRGISGDHDEWICIFKINEQYFEVIGGYTSYDGIDIYDLYNFSEVKPVEKTITIYEKV